MSSITEYEAWKARQQLSNVGKANIVLGQDWQQEPDQFAADLNFAKEASEAVGNPVPLMMVQDPDTRSIFQRRMDEKRNSTILTSAPKLTDWLRVPGNADLTRDDLEGLSWWERMGKSSAVGNATAITQGQQFTRDLSVALERSPAGQALDAIGDTFDETLLSNPDGTPNMMGQLANMFRAPDRQVGGLNLTADEKAAQLAAADMSPIFDGARNILTQLDAQGFKPTGLGDVNSFGSTVQYLADNIGMAGPQMGAAIASGAFAPLLQVAMLGGQANDELKQRTDIAPDQRVAIATGAGVVMSALETFGLSRIFGGLPVGDVVGDAVDGLLVDQLVSRGVPVLAAKALEAAIAEGTTEALQEGIVIGVTALSGGEYTQDEILGRLTESFVGGAAVGGALRAGAETPAAVVRTTERLQEQQSKADAAKSTTDILTEIASTATTSVTRTRSPDTFRDFIQTVTANGGRENLFVPAAQFVEYFQSAGLDPFELADQLSGMSRSDVETAMETGGSVQIPTATWAADMAGSEHDQFVIQNSAFSPDAMTAMQAAEFEADKQGLLAEAWAEAEAVRAEADSLRQIYDQELEQAVSGLRAAGRATDVATAEALPLVAFRRTMAERMSLTPEEFAARYPLPEVRGERPEGLDPKNVDELTRTLAEARGRRSVGLDTKKTPLMEFISERGGIVDPGGELKNLGVAVVKRPGKKTLKLERTGVAAGMRDLLGGSQDRGLDTTARAAVESGFLGDDPDVLAWKEAERNGTEAPDLSAALLRAIEREAAGDTGPVADDLGGIEEYLAGLKDKAGNNLSLDDSNETIRQAIADRDGAEGRAYGQPAYHGTPHLFEKFSTDNIGSGEGNQAYGWGLYFSSERAVAQHYRSAVTTDDGPRGTAATVLAVTKDEAITRTRIAQFHKGISKADIDAAIEFAKSERGHLYEVEIPDNDDLINWDAPMSRQSAKVLAILKQFGVTEENADTGQEAYARLAELHPDALPVDDPYYDADHPFPSDKNASEALKAAGIPGHRYIGDKTENYVIYDDSSVAVRSYEQADAGFGMGGGSARGSIQFPGAGVSNGQTVISLFKTADLSTFLHETGHYFLTVTQDMARLDPTGSAAAELETVKAWWRDNADAVARDAGNGVTADDVRAALDNGTSGDAAKDRLIDTGMQEQFARATEQYFLEGKAPSVELRGAFEKFSAWLLSIYRSLKGTNVNVTDELRGVFDRMLATDAEIDAARADIGADVNLTAADLGMTAEQFAGFLKLRDQAKDEAKAKALNEAMLPIRRAATKAYQAERAKVHDRIETETKQQPVYRAIQELRFGRTFDGAEVDNPLKLNRAMIEAEYGAGYIPFLPGATKDGSGHRNAVFSTEGGVHPDITAGAYGFPTGRDMLDALANAPDMVELINAETAKEMEFRHNDPLKDGSIQQTAMDAVHGDLQGQVLAARLDAFNEIAGTDRGLSHKQAREAARRSLRGMAVKDATRADRFLAAERKAAAEVAKLTATVTRTTMWADAARRKVEKQARGAVREGDAKAAASLPMDRANETAMRQNKDAAALVEASRRQLLNHMLYSEARKVAADTDSTVKRISMLRKANARLAKTRDINFVYAARAVAAKFGLTRADTPFDFNAWLEQLRHDDPVTAAAMVNSIDTYSQEAKPYKDLTVSEFGAVKDAIDSLLALAKTTRGLEIDGQRVDRRDAIDAMIAVAEPRGKVRAGTLAAPTKGQKTWLQSLTTGAALVRTEAWARDMDDGNAGVFTRYLVKPVMDALSEYRADRTKRLDQLLAIVEPRRGELLGAAVNAPELGYTFENKGALLHALLHTGNDSNKKKLLLGRGWSKGMINAKPALTKAGKPRVDRQGQPIMDKGTLDTGQWDAFVNRMIAEGKITAADKKMVEDIWTLMDAMKRPAQTAHKRIYGHYFSEIEAAPFTNALGTWRGGYVPAIIDQWASVDAGKQDAAAALDSQMDASMFPTTGSGFTKGRVEYNQPLALNLQSLPGHMDKVLRFTHLEPTIRQTSSLLTDNGLRAAIGNVNRDAIDAILTPWLVRTARQAVETPSTTASGRAFGTAMRTIRKRVGLHMMALNIVNAAQQVTGIPTAAVLVKVKHLKGATVRYAKDAGTMRNEAINASAMMRDRMDNSSRMTAQEIDKIIVEPTIQAEVDKFVSQHGYILQQVTQNVVDVVVWHGAYDQAVQHGMSADDAVFEADSVVRRTQGSFNPEDVSAFETGTAFQRVFTMFTSYFNTMLNLVGGEAMTAIRTTGWSGKQRLFHLYFFGIMVPAVVAEAISQAARGELGDEDDDGLLDDMLDLFVGSQVKFLAGTVPLLGPLTVALLNNFNDQSFDDKLSVSPANYVLERAVRAPATIAGAVTGEGSPSRAVADGITALGLITGIPTGQLAKSAGYLVGIGEGKSEPQNALDVARGVMSGRDGTE